MLSARPEEAGGMFDWDEGDRFSFEDSDRFEEDSLCSWISEPESSCNNWRGWKKQNGNSCGPYHLPHSKNKGMVSLYIKASIALNFFLFLQFFTDFHEICYRVIPWYLSCFGGDIFDKFSCLKKQFK